MKTKTKMKTKIKSNCPKNQGRATPEPFLISEQEKKDLGLLAITIKTVDSNFNLHTFLMRRKKLRGRFPPADKVIKICRQVLKNKNQFKGHNLWAYFTTAVNKEEAMSFAEKNIKEGVDFKKMQPIGILLNPALLERGIK